MSQSRLLGPADIRRLATRANLRPSKARGQNFVHDANTIRRIVAVAGVLPGEPVLEIGPGLGSLTLGLLAAGARVHAIEVDHRLANQLPTTVAELATPQATGRLTVQLADALRLTAADLPEPPAALVANLPYNIAVPVLLHTLEVLPSIWHGLVLVQLEVAERLAGLPGTSNYGAPSAKLAWYATTRLAGRVARSVFWPVPNVDSGLVAFVRHGAGGGGSAASQRPGPEGPGLAGPGLAGPGPDGMGPDGMGPDGMGLGSAAERQATFAVIDAAFAQRRKMLRSALSGIAGSAMAAEMALRQAGVDPAARGETLSVGDFRRIATILAGNR